MQNKNGIVPTLLRVSAKIALVCACTWAGIQISKNLRELQTLGKDDWIASKQRSLRHSWAQRGINWGLGHTGVTVSNFERAVQFYDRVFDMKLMNYLELSGSDLSAVQNLYHVEGLKKVRLGFLASRSGNVLEVFEIDPPLDTTERETWNRPGYTHIAFHVSGLSGWMHRLEREGVEFMNEPVHSSGTDWVFFRDPDGNLIELIDLRAARWGLGRLGAIIGQVFKHTSFRDFYHS